MSTDQKVHPVDERPPILKLGTLGLQHVLVMYAGAIAVPLIIGRALNLSPEQVAMLISADLFCCGLVTLIQAWGFTKWFGIRLPVMMGVTFASVGPMMAVAAGHSGAEGASIIFGPIIGSGLIAIFLAPVISRLLAYFPPIVTGTVITVIGITLMKVAIDWIFGLPFGSTAPQLVDPAHAQWLASVTDAAKASGGAIAAPPPNLALAPSMTNNLYAALPNIGLAALVLVTILLIAKFATGFIANISVLIGMVVGALVAIPMGLMHFDHMEQAGWFAIITPLQFGMPQFHAIPILTMTLVMLVSMIESTGMFLALGDITEKPVSQVELTRGLRTDGFGTVLGGLFNTFPYTSFSQNVGLVGVTGVRSRYVCVAAGFILMFLGMIPKMAAFVEALPIFVLGGAGLVMFGMVAATGMRILATVDFNKQKNNLFIVAVSIGLGMIPMIAPDFKQWMPHGLHPIIDSGILLASVSALVLNLFFNGPSKDTSDATAAAQLHAAH